MKYYIDFEKFSLEELKESLQKRDMIPSRVMLKQDIEERFTILTSLGIKTLKDLLDALKTKDKIEAFSKRSELSIEYLTLLKREVNSYHPNPITLSKFPDVDSNAVNRLEKSGIKNSKQFFDKVIRGPGIKRMASELGVSVDKLNELASLSDLARLYGVGPVFARMIYDVGINSIERFVEYTAKEFIELYENKTKKKADFGENDINFSIEMATMLILKG